jgi:hypothetical protein
MNRKKRKKRNRLAKAKAKRAALINSVVTHVTTTERVVSHTPFLKLVGIGHPFPQEGGNNVKQAT